MISFLQFLHAALGDYGVMLWCLGVVAAGCGVLRLIEWAANR
jgi:hypothetical protein